MAVNWIVAGQVLSGVLAALGGAGIVQAIARRRTTRVEAIAALNATTLDWAEQLKADAKESRDLARESRREAAEVRTELAECRRDAQVTRRLVRTLRNDAEAATGYMHWLVRTIAEPDMTIEKLRILTDERPPPSVSAVDVIAPD